ncbi:MAG: hypothetical protein GYA17_07970, partial [Chloroflexi bacterium]|nr:hypothetical protein [Chloroflexota bacterium]
EIRLPARGAAPRRAPAFPRRWAWAALAVVALLAALLAFRQPVLAAAGRLLGYVYFPEIGFVPLDSTRVLRNPVMQGHAGAILTATRGLATRQSTTLWLEYNAGPASGEGAWLEDAAGARLEVTAWQYDHDASRLVLTFPALPAEMDPVTLALPEGWRLPLEWIPAGQSNLPDVRIVPYPGPSTAPGALTPTPADLCAAAHGLRVCLLAAAAGAHDTTLLLEAQSTTPGLLPGDAWQGLAWGDADRPVSLRDAAGGVYSLSGQQGSTLTFPALPAASGPLTLTLPAVLARADIPDQLIRVDVGDDPRPGQVIPLDATVQVYGASVHFRQATLVGDGVNSLRLTLEAGPVESANGLTPLALEMGKPERVDDLYGSGNLDGSKDLFVELLRPQGALHGVLELPVVSATLIVSGPFEFTFTPTPAAAPATPPPAVATADPGSFSPAPSATPLPLESYRSGERRPQPGDLLFTVLQGETTALYAAGPGLPSAPQWVADLPGQVFQVYLHPDRQGIDYVAGTLVQEDGFTFFRGAQLFTLRFDEARPRLLAAFPFGPQNVKGNELAATWSADGRLVAFQQTNRLPAPGEPLARLGWIDLACRQDGHCPVQYVDLPPGLEAGAPQFSPTGRRLLLSGSSTAPGSSGAMDVFLLPFDEQGRPGELINLSDSPQTSELVPHWNPAGGQVVALCPTDPSEAQRRFCLFDPSSGARQDGAAIDRHLFDYQVALDGEHLLGIDIDHQAGGKGLLEFRRFAWDGSSGPLLARAGMLAYFAGSPGGDFFAYIETDPPRLRLVDASTGAGLDLPGLDPAAYVTWLGWVN